jgi:alkylhydroperoxidase family enzyme
VSSHPPSDRTGRPIHSFSKKFRSFDKPRSDPAHHPLPEPFAAVGEESWKAWGVLELARARVAQIHQCPESLAHHTAVLKARGDGARLDELETWHTSTLFTDAQRAALALCERLTLDPAEPLPDSLLQEMHRYFTNDGIISVTMAIMAAIDWNFFHALYPATPRSKL